MPEKPHTSAVPEIIESYRDFQPPPSFRETIEILLSYVPPKYLVGLSTIVLTNRGALSSNERKRKVWSRNRKGKLADALGSYHHATRSSSAAVWLYVDNISSSGIWWFRMVPFLRFIVQADVLYHEIGHHIHAAHRPVHDGKENVAEDWSRRLSRDFFRRHYRYSWRAISVLTRPVLLAIKWAGLNKNMPRH